MNAVVGISTVLNSEEITSHLNDQKRVSEKRTCIEMPFSLILSLFFLYIPFFLFSFFFSL
jgi:hypothetical protein